MEGLRLKLLDHECVDVELYETKFRKKYESIINIET